MDLIRFESMLERLAALSAEPQESEIAREGTELVADTLGLHQAALIAGGKAQRPEVIYSRGVDEGYLAFVVEQYMNLPGARIMVSGQPFVVPDVREHPAYAPILDRFERAGIRALVLFAQREPAGPASRLAAGDAANTELFGVLAAYHSEPVIVDPVALALANCVSQHVAALLWGHRVRRDRDFYERMAVLERSHDAVSVMTAGVVHDFNNVLGAVLALVSLWPGLSEDARRVMQAKLRTQAEQASRMTRSLLDIFRPRGPVAQDAACELVSQTQRAVLLTSATAHPDTRIEVTSQNPEHWGRIDSAAFSRIILNLMLNAVQAMGSRSGSRLSVKIRDEDDSCLVEVDDNGPGIGSGEEERIFEPYVSIGKGSGTGVGLAAARGLAEQAGGTLSLRHRSGPGACFVISLPKAAPAPEPAPSAPVPVPLASPTLLPVLVAEDEALQRALFARSLREAGFEVFECGSGDEAIDALLNRTFGAAVIDQRMPGATGLAVLRRMRAAGQTIPVVMVSGFEVEQQNLLGPDFANTRVVRKPLSGAALVAVLREML